MTVFGGLQFIFIGEDAVDVLVSIPMTVFGGLQFQTRYKTVNSIQGFNTDDGIWRAAMLPSIDVLFIPIDVSIPMTVFGGLQYFHGIKTNISQEKFQYR